MNEMNRDNGSAASGILLAAAAGAVVGAGVALLFAPCSGAETRQWLARRTREVTDGTTRAIERGKDAIRRGAGELRRDVAEAGASIGSTGPVRS